MAKKQKNFRFSQEMLRQIEALMTHYGENESDLMRRLISERYALVFGEVVCGMCHSKMERLADSTFICRECQEGIL